MIWRFTINPDSDNIVIDDPIGWNDAVFTVRRDQEWHGVFFEFTFPLQFYNGRNDDTFAFIKSEYEENGVEGFIILQVELDCDGDFEIVYTGRLNFTKIKFFEGVNCTVELPLEPENCLMTFKNRYDQKVDLNTLESFDGTPLSDYDKLSTSISLPPKAVPQWANLNSVRSGSGDSFTDVLQEDTVSAGTGTVEHEVFAYFWFGMEPGFGNAYFAADGRPDNLDEIEDRNNFGNGSSEAFVDMLPIYKVKYDGTYDIYATVQGGTLVTIQTNGNNTDCSGDQDTFNYMKHEVFLIAGATTILLYSADFTGCLSPNLFFPSIPVADVLNTVTLNAGDEIFLYTRVEASGEWNRDLIDEHPLNWTVHFNGYAMLDVYAITFSEPTNARCYLINETGSRILEAITDNCFQFLSDYYGRTDSEPYHAPSETTGCGALRCFTTGLNIRQFPAFFLRMSFKEFFEGLNAIDNVGIGLETGVNGYGSQQVVRMEPMEYFYTSSVIHICDRVPEITKSPVLGEHYSIYKFGYSKWEAEEYTGLDEFNTSREYRTALTTVKNTLTQVCDFIASGYAIEITRRKQYNSTTQADWRFDDETFIICLRFQNIYLVEQGNISLATDLIDPASVYNWRLSPIRNALRWMKTVLNSYRNVTMPASEMIFTAGTGNYLASGKNTTSCVIEADPIAEDATLDINRLEDIFEGFAPYLPELWEFDFPLSFTDYNDIKDSPYDLIQVRHGQNIGFNDCYVREVVYRPNEGMASFKLLPARALSLEPCCWVTLNLQSDGTDVYGSSILIGAAIENILFMLDGEYMKFQDVINNEINTFEDTTGYFLLNNTIGEGRQITIIKLPSMGAICCPEVINISPSFEDRDGGLTYTNPLLEDWAIGDLHFIYDGTELKWNDADPDFNEIVSFDGVTGTYTFNEDIYGAGGLNPDREFRIWGVKDCLN